jgi:hypothetical protein
MERGGIPAKVFPAALPFMEGNQIFDQTVHAFQQGVGHVVGKIVVGKGHHGKTHPSHQHQGVASKKNHEAEWKFQFFSPCFGWTKAIWEGAEGSADSLPVFFLLYAASLRNSNASRSPPQHPHQLSTVSPYFPTTIRPADRREPFHSSPYQEVAHG